MGRAKIGQVKIGPIFRAKILLAQPALKTGLVGPNNFFKAKKKSGGSGHTGLGHIGPEQIWPGFFRANNLMAQPGPNFGRTRLAHRAELILPPLCIPAYQRSGSSPETLPRSSPVTVEKRHHQLASSVGTTFPL